ncbi:MAG: hypothetical protein AAB267_07505, partial [Candidatus Desantisbacteria bacterium]
NVMHVDKAETDWSMKELSDAYVAAQNDPGEKYWQNLLNQHLDEKERDSEIISEMITKDYGEGHNEDRAEGESDKETSGEAGREQESSEGTRDAGQDEGGEAGDMGAAEESDFDQGCDFDSGDFDADGSGYTGYIG